MMTKNGRKPVPAKGGTKGSRKDSGGGRSGAQRVTKASKTAPAREIVKTSKRSTEKAATGQGVRSSKARGVSPSPRLDGDKVSGRVQFLLDESDIVRLLASMARAFDRLDDMLLRSVLPGDGVVDFGPGLYQGSSSDFIAWIMDAQASIKSSHHLMGQTRIDVEGDSAFAESYLHITVKVDKPVGREDVFLGVRWLTRLERRLAGGQGVWRIVHFKQVFDWARTELASELFYHHNPDALWSHRGKPDPSSVMRGFSGGSGGKQALPLTHRRDKKTIRY